MSQDADRFGLWLIDLDSSRMQRNVRCRDVCAFSSAAGVLSPRMPTCSPTKNIACGGGSGVGRMRIGMESIRVG
jgi:hypothetical protein